jgi:hypothetical protein
LGFNGDLMMLTWAFFMVVLMVTFMGFNFKHQEVWIFKRSWAGTINVDFTRQGFFWDSHGLTN